MATKTTVPALGAEGWFTTDPEPTLLGQRCTTCDTYVFPKTKGFCPNPQCRGKEFDEVPLSRHGTVWSYTDARYQPPPPYVVPGGEFEPFAIAAVHFAAEGLTVLGQVVAGVGVDELLVGDEVEVATETLFSDDEHDYLIWKWRPTGRRAAGFTAADREEASR